MKNNLNRVSPIKIKIT